jgi:hypothetical protein
MSEALTLVNREFKGDVDSSSRRSFTLKLNARFPSYFGDFCSFKRFLVLEMPAAFAKGRLRPKRQIPPAAAFMAIV